MFGKKRRGEDEHPPFDEVHISQERDMRRLDEAAVVRNNPSASPQELLRLKEDAELRRQYVATQQFGRDPLTGRVMDSDRLREELRRIGSEPRTSESIANEAEDRASRLQREVGGRFLDAMIRQPLSNGEFVLEPTQTMRGWARTDPGTLHIFNFSNPFRTECDMQIDHAAWFHPTGGVPFPLVCGVCARRHEADIYAHMT